MDANTQQEARTLVHAFLDAVKPVKAGKPTIIEMRSTKLITIKKPLKVGSFVTAKDERVALEPLINGEYEKFNSNSGCVQVEK